jgi:hypothetical protein
VGEFFQPPSSASPEQAEGGDPPPWTGRPQGTPPGVVLSDLELARSRAAAVYIAYLDAYPEGFEFDVEVIIAATEHELRCEADEFGFQMFGGGWPMVGESSDVIPARLLRIGVEFADGRKAANISGHDRPAGGPVMWSLRGGGGGGRWHQGYWVSPLPSSGPVALACEWPIAAIPLVRYALDGRLMLDGARRARATFPAGQRVLRDGVEWRLGSDAEIAWVNDGTSPGTAITCAIPPIFASYCTMVLPRPNGEAELTQHEQVLIELLVAQTGEQSWWLGYLDTGASDVVFPYAPRATVYYGYGYVLVEAGPQQAVSWRDAGFKWVLPDLIFPSDRSWLLSTMWDDDWTCIGGSEQLVKSILCNAVLGPAARRVALGQDATPPGHEVR